MEETKQSPIQIKDLLIPGSIVIAGAIIAGTLFFTGGLPQATLQEQGNLFQELAKGIGVNMKKFNDCVSKRTYQSKVQEHQDEGSALGVGGTPGSFVNGTEVKGAISYEELKSKVDEALAGTKGSLADQIQITPEDHVRGLASAQVVILEFSDVQCPYCAVFHPTLQRILDDYGEKVRWVYRHYPIDSIHAQARPGAEASECVWEQKGDDGFWKFVDGVFKNQNRL